MGDLTAVFKYLKGYVVELKDLPHIPIALTS